MVNPATIGAAGDYSTIADWVSNEAGDFSGLGEVEGRLLNEAHSSGGSITGASNESASDHWLLTVESANRHAGVPTNSKAEIDLNGGLSNYGSAIGISDPYTVVEWVQFYRCYAGAYQNSYNVTIGAANSEIRNCIIWECGLSNRGAIGIRNNSVNNIEVHNNLIHKITKSAIQGSSYRSGQNFVQNTVYHYGISSSTGINLSYGGATGNVKNNLVMKGGGTGTCIGGGTQSGNITEDTSGGDSTTRTDGDIDFTDAANDDFSLNSESSDAHDTGDELGSSYEVDLAGTTRGASNWDTGAFQYVSAATAKRRRVRMGSSR